MCIKLSGLSIGVITLACLIVVLTGCASQRHAVRCDGRLEPINMPAARTLERIFNAEQANLRGDRE